MGKLKVGVVFGGRSVEHAVSIASAASIVRALDARRYEVLPVAITQQGRWRLGAPGAAPSAVAEGAGDEVLLPAVPGARELQPVGAAAAGASTKLDVVFPVVHGAGGEDGALQGFLELAGVPYVGAGVLGSALQMDKDAAKQLLHAAGVPVVPWRTFRAHQLAEGAAASAARAREALGLPLFVKPANSGSSVGTTKVKREADLPGALQHAARYDEKVLVERAVDAREIEIAVLGNEAPRASVPGEIAPQAEWYDYEAKYADSATELIVPAKLPPQTVERLQRLALQAFAVLEGAGLARADFFVTREGEKGGGGEIYLNELNSLPGFTEISMYPRLWQASGLSYSALLDRLIELALQRHSARAALQREYQPAPAGKENGSTGLP